MKTHIHFKDSAYGYKERKPKPLHKDTFGKFSWEESLIAKIVEPEWKIDQKAYDNKTGEYLGEVYEILGGGLISIFNEGGGLKRYIKSDISHYYEGQIIDESELKFES